MPKNSDFDPDLFEKEMKSPTTTIPGTIVNTRLAELPDDDSRAVVLSYLRNEAVSAKRIDRIMARQGYKFSERAVGNWRIHRDQLDTWDF